MQASLCTGSGAITPEYMGWSWGQWVALFRKSGSEHLGESLDTDIEGPVFFNTVFSEA